MQNQIGYYSLGKAGRPNEDRFRLLGGGFLPQDQKYTGFQDSGRGEIYAVMDGVSSAPKGMKAAQHIADELMDFYTTDIPATISGLKNLVTQINQSIVDWGITDDQHAVGASTLTLAWLFNQQLHIFHVGDSTGFLMNSSGFMKVTQPHENDYGLFRFMGQRYDFCLDIKSYPLNSDDTICLVTDGITKKLKNPEIQKILEDYAGEPDLAARKLVETAKQRKVQDDITAIVIEVAI
ncbi:MAG: protein phosphatase 2C domain-containing protein [Methylococcaceae bacterium]